MKAEDFIHQTEDGRWLVAQRVELYVAPLRPAGQRRTGLPAQCTPLEHVDAATHWLFERRAEAIKRARKLYNLDE